MTPLMIIDHIEKLLVDMVVVILKSFKLVDTELPSTSMSFQHRTESNWSVCMICQEYKGEQLT